MFLTKAITKANEFAKKGVTIVTHGLNIWVAQFVEGGKCLKRGYRSMCGSEMQ